jgi:hypothetical protein
MAKSTVNAANFIGSVRGYPTASPLTPTESGMPDRRPVNWDRGAIMKPECPAAWQLTAQQLAAAEAEIRVIQTAISDHPILAGALSEQLKAAEQKVARHQAYIAEHRALEASLAAYRATQAIGDAVRAAVLRGIDFRGALDDFISAISIV